MSESVIPLFVYGSLLSPDVLRLVIGRVIEPEPAKLSGYACYYVEGATFPGIFPEKRAETQGALLRGMSNREIEALDRYEDYFYERQAVCVETSDGQVEAMAYVVVGSHENVLSDRLWTWEEFQELHLTAYVSRMS